MKTIPMLAVSLCMISVSACTPRQTPAEPHVNESSAKASNTGSGFEHFITRRGSQLFDGEVPFRFAGLHATELHRIEDDVKSRNSPLGKSDHFKWPTAREQDNWVKSLVLSGHTATRIYALSIEDIDLSAEVRAQMPAHVLWDVESETLTLNEDGMRVLDNLIALADQHQLRLIIPFVDHWSWWGGKRELALMAGEPGRDDTLTGSLYDTRSKTFALYQQLIRAVITRKNTVTGRRYSEEKAIMAWETGNELRGTTAEFLAQTAALIKHLAPDQLIVDGDQQADNINAATGDILAQGEFLGLLNADVDIQSNHYYGDYVDADVLKFQADLVKQHDKVFFLGEFGLLPVARIESVLDASVAHPAVGGALVWGYRGHREAGGFYWHKEGNSGHWSYHLPGFAENDDNQERAVVGVIRDAQARLANNPGARHRATHWPLPEAPLLHPIGKSGAINWMGSPTATQYDLYVRRAGGNWALLAAGVTDARNEWDPATMDLFSDTSCKAGDEYRVVAINDVGESEASAIQVSACD